MTRRALFVALPLICILALAAFWIFRESGRAQTPSALSKTTDGLMAAGPRPSSQPARSSAIASAVNGTSTVNRGTSSLALASDILTQQRAAASDPQLVAVKQIVRDYRAALGENPVGTNSEITKALLGANSHKASFVSDQVKLSTGQLVDRWNHPYFFHQLSRSQLQIRSAGPDGKMWTADDEVSR
jgi:hypothetical protein